MRRVVLTLILTCGAFVAVAATPATADAPNTCAGAIAASSLNSWHKDSISSAADVDWFRFTLTSSRWALVTLGGLSANLALGLYDGSCHLIVASDHASNRFEQIYRSFGAGHYVVRVSGDAGATSAYSVRFVPLSTGTHVLSTHAYPQYRQLYIDGEVLNNSSEPIFYRWTTVTFYNAAGSVIATRDGPGFPQPYARARGRVPLDGGVTAPATYARYRVNVVSEAVGTYPAPPKMAITASPTWTDTSGRAHFPGSITNESPATEFLHAVCVTVYDAYGQVRYVGLGGIEPSQLAPHQTGGYDAQVPSAAGVNASARIFC